jgi:GTP-binding protein Era
MQKNLILKTGYVAILGKPNAGKSTLMNSLLGQKLSIITSKPQTTRKKILGILSGENFQIIFLDTPGIIKPSYLLHEKMMEFVESSIKDADILILIVDVDADPDGVNTLQDEYIHKILIKCKKKKILLINKIDLTTQEHVKLLLQKFATSSTFEKIIPVSAKVNFNLEEVISSIVADANERFFVSEIIREKIFELYKEEIPYSCEVLINDFKEREEAKFFIQAEIIVEKETQKAIIIGKQGSAIKKLGEAARKAIEDFLQHEVFLELRVKVRNKWRSDEKLLRSFGYSSGED